MVAKVIKRINNLLDTFIERSMYSIELWKWEKEKRVEGFPKEWFEGEEE
jgi:hypothetical protein